MSDSSMSRLLLRLCLFLLCLGSVVVRAETLSPEEARKLLKLAEQASIVVGSFKDSSELTGKHGHTQTTTLSLRTHDKKFYSRTETVTTSTKGVVRTRIQLSSDEGIWELSDGVAIMRPPQPGLDKIKEEAMQLAAENAKAGIKDPKKIKTNKPFLKQALILAAHTQHTGERFMKDGISYVTVTVSMDPEGQEAMKKIAKHMFSEMKKQFSFGKRLLISTMMSLIDMDKRIPTKTEHLIDETNLRIVETRQYNAKGDMIGTPSGEKSPQRIEDLPLSTFEVPANFKKLRPANQEEYIDLKEKLSKEKRKAEKEPKAEEHEEGSESP